ncbi:MULTISPECIES: hypothetical protein [Pseudomonas]|uniref:hypothetical protein n=1 Tax=Pseudomonas TaxID=286 RepID=UPI0007E315D3|nr:MULTISPECIES: hypothetical protein [Pseudomonas]
MLAEVDTQDAATDELQLIRQAELILQGAPADLNWPWMTIAERFSLLKGLFRLVRALAISPSAAGQQFLAALDVDIASLKPTVDAGLKLECLSNAERSHLLSAVSRILSAGADRFRAAAEDAQLCPSIRDAASSSAQLSQLMPRRPSRAYVRTVLASSRRPRSPRSVLKAWLRFKRKVLRSKAVQVGHCEGPAL